MKVHRFSQYQGTFSFNSAQENYQQFVNRFYQSDLGKIYVGIPWDGMVKQLGLKSKLKGPSSLFSPRGKIALMFLKNYSGCSDKRLIEQLNSNIDYQFFCDIYLGLDQRLENFKIVSEIRCELSKKLNIEKMQQLLAEHWRPWMADKNCMLTDATCYETQMRYPTNQKLLWESVNWSYGQLKLICKYLKIKLPRTKYLKWKDRYYQYSRKRRRSVVETRVITRSMLSLLKKLDQILASIESIHSLELPKRYWHRRKIIRTILKQQQGLFVTGASPKNRIVRIDKDYIRPIVRGKETKAVEFGAKVNKIQVDGISFIEHISFEAFHEGIRFKSSIFTAQTLMKTLTTVVGADAIYATNENRRFATSNRIRTDFKRKGKASKHELHRKQLAAIIIKERASKLEGSFGKEKEHYHLKKIKARTKETEILWIFFGIHVANALQMGSRIKQATIKRVA
jgi:hypothetical protein